jgi:putative transposase
VLRNANHQTIQFTDSGYGERKRNFVGQHFWARGYFVSTVGRDEAVIRKYVQHQEREDQRLDQLNLWR